MAVSAPPILKTLKTKDMIAKTILQQIGGKRFTAMTGSRDFIDMGNGLRMSLARNKTSANRLDIIYDEGADLYNMRFYRRTFSKKTFECKTKDIAVHEGIYFDMLEEMFTMVTGLYTRCGGGGRREPPYFLSVSMMADKESSKETFVQSAITKKSASKTCGGYILGRYFLVEGNDNLEPLNYTFLLRLHFPQRFDTFNHFCCSFLNFPKYFLHNFAILFMVNNYVLYCSHNTYNLKCYLETDRQKWLNDVN